MASTGWPVGWWLVVGFDKLLSEIGFLTNGDQCGAKTEKLCQNISRWRCQSQDMPLTDQHSKGNQHGMVGNDIGEPNFLK